MKNIHVIVEPDKQGIAMAYVTGMCFAKDMLGADAFVEFDGDGQHNPADVPRLVEALTKGYDYAIGSRYVPGGSVPEQWAPHRKLLSRVGSLYARILLEVPVHDVTSGLKATKTSSPALPKLLEVDQLLTRHYAYKIHFLYEIWRAGAQIQEVPIVFRLREHDTSKSTWRDIMESLKVTGILRLRTLREWRLLRVLAIGGIGFVVQTVLFELLGFTFALMKPSTAVVVGGEVAILSNFFLNARFSFSDRGSQTALPARLLRFHLVSLGSIILQWLLVHTAELATENRLVLWGAYIAGVGLGLLFNYTGYYFWVWRNEH
jgi:dolichol-phosphate mannosyltransferase